MFELYTWMTDNGYKARQMAEESGLEYELKPVNIREKDQFEAEYLKIRQATRSQRSSTTTGPRQRDRTVRIWCDLALLGAEGG